MNIDELRDELQQLAGPVPRATATARAAVGARVRRGRRRRNLTTGGASALAAALVVAIVAVGLNSSNGPVKVRTTSPSATTAPPSDAQCALGVRTVPPTQVPRAVAAWLHGLAAVGGNELWTARRSIASGPVHDSAVWRLKIGWFTTPFGIPKINARRLDGPGVATGDANEAFDQRGKWVASTIELPSAGCWEITARFDRSAIVFRRLIGNPPRPLAIGTISGVLETVGGLGPGTPHPIAGTIHIDGTTTALNDFGISVETDAHGMFRVDLPVGRHVISGTSPHYLSNGRPYPCAGGTVTVRRARTTHIDVGCPIR